MIDQMLGSGDLTKWHRWVEVSHRKDDMRQSLNDAQSAGEVSKPYMAPSQIQRSSAETKPVEVKSRGGSTTKSCRRVCDLGANRNAPHTSVDAKDQEAPAAFLRTHLRAVESTPPA